MGIIQQIVLALTQPGGLLRVRSSLAITLTAVGGTYLILYESMPPDQFNIIWGMVVTHYFATRGANTDGSS